ncbi:hypothetical protein, partial [Snodgrassella sp. ESL0253]|uniref:hypothetical protein n=1 Tax=Snodgrassella sp. ESL0253 TaxID=2705031 RepID=UPI0019323A9B
TVIAVESTDVLAGLATGAVTVSNLPASAIKSTSKIGGKYAEEIEQIGKEVGKGSAKAMKGPNYKVYDLKDVQDQALNLNSIRQATQDYLKSSYQDKAVSYAVASVNVNGKTEYFLSVSGKAWSGSAPTTVKIGGVNYKVIVTDSKSIPNVSTSATQTNYNHAEQKLFSYIHDTFKGQKADVNIAVQNTSKYEPGMCVGCGSTSQSFAEANKGFNIKIFQGTTGKNP